MAVSINGTSGLVFTDGTTQNTSPFGGMGFRNRIINGAMMIDQRNSGGSVNSAAGGAYAVDRFGSYASGGGVYTTQRSTDVPTGAGFSNSIVCTVTTSSSPSGINYYLIQQGIEGYNVADLQWGTANAKTVTVSFWVKSSITGTYTVALRNVSLTRTYCATYTINSANTWEQKSITIAGDTTGTWATDNTTGVYVDFTLGAGSSFTTTGNVWQGAVAQAFAATGQTQWISTNGATFYITGVQVEKGSTATSFDYRPYGTELALCQRYYQKSVNNAQGAIFFGMPYVNGTQATGCCPFKVSMRASPTVVLYDGASNAVGTCTQQAVADGIAATAANITPEGFMAVSKSSGTFTVSLGYAIVAGFTASAEL